MQGAEPSPDGAADGEEAYSGLTAQATATMSAAKCSVKLATMQVSPAMQSWLSRNAKLPRPACEILLQHDAAQSFACLATADGLALLPRDRALQVTTIFAMPPPLASI